ncbi:MAG: hypothetical protein ABL933_15770 [Methyloglobulus sp.]
MAGIAGDFDMHKLILLAFISTSALADYNPDLYRVDSYGQSEDYMIQQQVQQHNEYMDEQQHNFNQEMRQMKQDAQAERDRMVEQRERQDRKLRDISAGRY